MAYIDPLDPADAPPRAREVLNDIVTRTGSAGAMIRTMAHSPALLQGYLDLSRAMKRAKLPRATSEKVSLAVQEWIGCELCLAAHKSAGKAAGLSETDISMARQGTATHPAEAALLDFAVRVLVEPSGLAEQDVLGLRTHGWSDRAINDVVGLVALNQLTGSFNLAAGLRPDGTDEDLAAASADRASG